MNMDFVKRNVHFKEYEVKLEIDETLDDRLKNVDGPLIRKILQAKKQLEDLETTSIEFEKKVICRNVCGNLLEILRGLAEVSDMDFDLCNESIQAILYYVVSRCSVGVVDIIGKVIEDEEIFEYLLRNVDFYNNLFLALGDFELFNKLNAKQAFAFYNLIQSGKNAKVTENDFNGWHNFVENYNEIKQAGELEDNYHLIIAGDIVGDVELDEHLQVYISQENQDYYLKWEKANKYVECVIDKLKNGISREEARKALLLAFLLADQALLRELYLIARGKVKKSEQEIRNLVLYGNNEYMLIRLLQHINAHVTQKNASKAIIDLVDVDLKVKTIQQVLSASYTYGEMGYYTSLQTLLYILPRKNENLQEIGKFSVMHVAYMNDPNEGSVLKKAGILCEYEKEEREDIRYPFVFMKSFTSRVDDLPMWEIYGDRAQGCCILFDLEKMRNDYFAIEKKMAPLYKVCYVRLTDSFEILKEDNEYLDKDGCKNVQETLHSIKEIVNRYSRNKAFQDALAVLAEPIKYLFKSADYAYEKEVRLVYHLQSGLDSRIKHTDTNPPKLYIYTEMDVRIKEVILGPKFADVSGHLPYLQERMDILCSKQEGIFPIKISHSGIEYK